MKALPQKPIPGYLGKCISLGEHQQQDFKYAINDSRKIAETLSAFSNTDGGRLLIGVKDNGKIAGIRSDEEMYMVEGAGELYCQPPVKMEFQTWEYENKLILEVWVKPSSQRPHKAKTIDGHWKAFVREKDQNFIASPVHLKLWEIKDQNNEQPAAFTDDEKAILDTITKEKSLALNPICKRVALDRKYVIEVIANFVRWDLVEISRANDKFVFAAKEIKDN